MEKRLRIAGVGAGYFSQFHYDAWSRLDVDLVAICNKTEVKARELADRYGIGAVYDDLEQMLDDLRPDLLDVITPPETHMACIEAAAARRIPVICQKPFTPDMAQAERAVEVMDRAGTLLVVHENFRFQPWYAEVRRILQSGALGQLYQVTFRLRPGDGQGPDAYLARQPYFQTMKRFLVHETAIHLIDVFRYLFGEVSNVTAMLSRLNPAIAGEDAGVIVFTFENGVRGLFDGNRLADHPAKNRRLTMGEMLVEGSAGSLRLDGDARLFWRVQGENAEQEVSYQWEDRGFGGDCVYRLQQHVAEHLRSGKAIMNTGRAYLANLKIEQAVYESHERGVMIVL